MLGIDHIDSVFNLKGAQDDLSVFPDRITISPRSALGFFTKGLKGVKTIPFKHITGTQCKEGSRLTRGFLAFSVPGNVAPAGLLSAMKDENSFVFDRHLNDEVKDVVRYIEQQIQALETQSHVPSLSTELAGLAALHKQGAITAEEYALAKSKVISQSK